MLVKKQQWYEFLFVSDSAGKKIPNILFYLVVVCISLIISFLLYGNVLTGEFVYDDTFFSERQDLHKPNSLLQIWTQPYQPQNTETGGGFYRPLWVASLALNFIFFGSQTLSFHIFNTIIYAAILFLLFLLVYKITENYILASFTALFFAFLPIHSEVVSNIKSRDELLSVFFILLSWYIFNLIEYVKSLKDWKIWTSAFLFFCALLSKEGVILIPLIFFFVWYLYKKPYVSEIVKTLVPFITFLFIYFPLRVKALGIYAYFTDKSDFIMNQLSDASLLTRISTSFHLIFLYILKIFIPYNLSASYDYAVIPTLNHPFQTIFGIAGVSLTIILIFIVFFKKTPRIVRIGFIFFFLSYLIISKIFYSKGAIFGERLIFLGTIGISLIVGWFFTEFYKRNKSFAVLSFVILCSIYALILIPRNKVWLTEKGFFEQMVKDQPNSVQARNGLAQGYFEMGRLNDAYIHAKEGYKIYSKHPPLVNLLGKLEYIKQDYNKALEYLSLAIYLKNNSFENHQFYCYTLTKLGRYQESIDHIKIPFANNPNDNELRFIMSINLYKQGKLEEALQDKYNWSNKLSVLERQAILEQF